MGTISAVTGRRSEIRKLPDRHYSCERDDFMLICKGCAMPDRSAGLLRQPGDSRWHETLAY